MKKRIAKLLMVGLLSCVLVGCGNQQETNNNTEQSTATESIETTEPVSSLSEEATITEEPTEPPHEHTYNEAITTEATCETDGEKSFICDCGDTYTEKIEATGHVYDDYVSNNDATYTADGTETATCACGLTDTRTAEGSKLEYTYTDLSKTMYAKSSVNVRNLPSTDGEKLGGINKAQEISVTGQCNETGWYRLDYNGGVAYVSNSYLVDMKPEEPKPEEPTEPSEQSELPFELYKVYDTGDKIYFWEDPADNSDATVAMRTAAHEKCWELAIARWGESNCAGFFQYDSYKANGKFYSCRCWYKTN